MKITQTEGEALIDALARALYIPEYDPATMVTIEDMAKRLRATKEVAKASLDKLEKAGELKVVIVRKSNGRKAAAYVRP